MTEPADDTQSVRYRGRLVLLHDAAAKDFKMDAVSMLALTLGDFLEAMVRECPEVRNMDISGGLTGMIQIEIVDSD